MPLLLPNSLTASLTALWSLLPAIGYEEENRGEDSSMPATRRYLPKVPYLPIQPAMLSCMF